MHSAIFLLTCLLVIGSFPLVNCRSSAAELFRDMLLVNKRHHNWNIKYGKRHNYEPEDVVLSVSKRYLKIDNQDELNEAQAALFNVNSQSGWILLNYVGPSTVHFAAGGDGDVEDLKLQLEDDEIQYGLVRLGGIQGTGTRDVFICWIGPRVGIIEKGKKSALLGDAKMLLQPFDAEVIITNKDHFDRDTLLDKSNPLSNSHVID